MLRGTYRAFALRYKILSPHGLQQEIAFRLCPPSDARLAPPDGGTSLLYRKYQLAARKKCAKFRKKWMIRLIQIVNNLIPCHRAVMPPANPALAFSLKIGPNPGGRWLLARRIGPESPEGFLRREHISFLSQPCFVMPVEANWAAYEVKMEFPPSGLL